MRALAIAVLVVAGATLLGSDLAAYPKPDDTPLPPAQYDFPYRGKLKVYTRSFSEMYRLCEDRVWACQWFAKQTCIVVMPRIDGHYVNREGYALLWRHEVDGHCAGWGYEGHGEHPGARYPHRAR